MVVAELFAGIVSIYIRLSCKLIEISQNINVMHIVHSHLAVSYGIYLFVVKMLGCKLTDNKCMGTQHANYV